MKELIASIKTIERAYKQALECPEIIDVGTGLYNTMHVLLKAEAFNELSSEQDLKYEHVGAPLCKHHLSFKIEGIKFVAVLSDEELLERYGVEARQTDEIKEAV